MTTEKESSRLLDSTKLAKLSRSINKARGGNHDLTVCEEEWERRLEGCKWAYFNVLILNYIFSIWKEEDNHCARDWQKRRNNGTLL